MKLSASATGKNLDQYIAKFRENPDSDFANQGKMMRSIVNRFEKLSLVWTQLKESSSFTRPFIFFRSLQADIFSATLHDFKMGISFTFESMIFGLLGIFIGSGLCLLRKVCFSQRGSCKTALPGKIDNF